MKIYIDSNGNKTLKINGKRIQTNGNLPETHRLGIGAWTEKEVAKYLTQIGK
jgi:hypothetical protein